MTIKQPGSRERYRKLDLPNGAAEVWLERAGGLVTMHTVRPNGSGWGNWAKCDEHGCLGQAVVPGSKCLGHASGASRLQYLSDLYDSHGALSLCGVEVSQELLDAILGSPIVEDRRIMVSINLAGAEINSRLDFTDYTFEGQFELTGAIIRQPANFWKCVFERHLSGQFAFFNGGPPSFNETNFRETVDFSFAHAERVSIGFTDCVFAKRTTADGINAALLLDHCSFQSDLAIRAANATIISLQNCSVDGTLDVANTHCSAFRANYLRSAAAHEIGPLDVKNDFTLSHAHFDARIAIEMRGKHLDLLGTQLVQGGHILIDQASVSLKQLSTGRLLQISGKSNGSKEPQILTLHDADAGSMAFAHVDMSRCIFYGAHDLGSVVIESTAKFASTPMGYTRRRCVADEFAWRRYAGGWRAKAWKLIGTRSASDVRLTDDDNDTIVLPTLRAAQVATVYRALRRSFEAQSDQPGAADFYYGEMEMRRHNHEIGFAERSIVFLYWTLSGYGLRAWRAFAWLLVLIAAGSYAISRSGFPAGPGTYLDGSVCALRAAVPGLSCSQDLTKIGDFIAIGLTLFGPVLLGLAFLALRARVKR